MNPLERKLPQPDAAPDYVPAPLMANHVEVPVIVETNHEKTVEERRVREEAVRIARDIHISDRQEYDLTDYNLITTADAIADFILKGKIPKED